MAIIGPPATTASTIGLADPREAPYYAKCDGITDDFVAFKKLHEAINSGTIKGYLIPGPTKIKGAVNLPKIENNFEIKFTNLGELDFSESTCTRGIEVKVGYGAAAALTAEAKPGEYTLKIGTAYEDGTILKLVDTLTKWDSSNTKSGELLEVGTPKGNLSGFNATQNVAAGIKTGEKIKELVVTNINPVGIWGASGKVIINSEEYEYTAVEESGFFVKLTLTEKTATEDHSQGVIVKLVPAAGTVYLRTPVTHELAYTVANESKVEPWSKVIRTGNIENCKLKGPGYINTFIGLALYQIVNPEIDHPVCTDTLSAAVLLEDCWKGHVSEPNVENTSGVNYNSGANGYGVVFQGATQDTSVWAGRTVRTRHAFTIGNSGIAGNVRRVNVADFVSVEAIADAFDNHSSTNDCVFERCIAIRPKLSGFIFHGPKGTMRNCEVIEPEAHGVVGENQGIGKTDYDFDCRTIKPVKSGTIITAVDATHGLNAKRIRVIGEIEGCGEHGVSIKGSGEGAAPNWRHKNIYVDVQLKECCTKGSGNVGVRIASAENATVRIQSEEHHKAAHQVEIKDTLGFVVHLGPLQWKEAATGKGCKVEGTAAASTISGTVHEGPMTNLSTAKSTEITSTNSEKVVVYPGPNRAVENKGKECEVVTIP